MKTKIDWILENLNEITKQTRDGASEKEIYSSLGISSSTWIKYKKSNPEIQEALNEGYKYSLKNVEAALYKAAVGYEFEEVTEERDSKGNMVITKVVKKKAQPNVSAIMNILKNKLDNEWNAAEKIDIKGKIEGKTSILSDVCSEDVAKMAAEMIRKRNKEGDDE